MGYVRIYSNFKMAFKRKFRSAKRSWKRKTARRTGTGTRTRALKALIKRTVLRKAEPKTTRFNYGKVELNHNSFPPATNLLTSTSVMPSQGVGDNQRVGDQINATGFKLKLLMGQKADRPNVTFRYFVVKLAKGTTMSYANMMHSHTFNVLLDDVNTDFCTVLKTGTWRPNEAGLAGTGNDEYTFTKTIYVPFKRTIKFGPADAAVTNNTDDIYFVLMAYDAYGSLLSDIIAYYQAAVEFNYRDP